MNFQKTTFFLLCISLLLIQNACFIPINNNFETAKTLKKNEIEIQGSASHAHSIPKESKEPLFSSSFGGQIGYGLTDKFDLKIRYEKILTGVVTDELSFFAKLFPTENAYGVNYIAITGKYSLIENKLAVMLPLSYYYIADEYRLYALSPTIIKTHEINEYMDLSYSGAIKLFTDTEYVQFGTGVNIGIGLNNASNKWSVRPEIGLQYVHDDGFAYNMGIGFQYRFNVRNSSE